MHFIIYGKDNCMYCTMAKNLLDRKGHTYDFRNMQKNPAWAIMFEDKFPDAKTVPQIVDPEGYHIGGFTDLEEYLRDRE